MGEASKDHGAGPEALGPYLKSLRQGLHMTLRDVEEASGSEISNAYLSQLENGKVNKPSPNILHVLAGIYRASYAGLMERAGYVVPDGQRGQTERHGRAATFAVENLTAEEEGELLKYLAWYRASRRGK